MPRFVRPAYIRVNADGVASSPSTGPRTRDGWLSAALTLRTSRGDVSDTIGIQAGGTRGIAEFRIPATMTATVERLSDGRTIVSVVNA